jgi:transcriptional regulator with GAF, ATPase, and Fis domain
MLSCIAFHHGRPSMSVSTQPRHSDSSKHTSTPDVAASTAKSAEFNGEWSRAISEQQLQFERLLLEVSAELVEGDLEEVNESIPAALERISELLGSELTTFLQRDPTTDILRHTHQWLASDASFLLDFTSQEDFDIRMDAPWVYSELVKGQPIVIKCLDDFPTGAAKEKLICQNTGIKSIVWVPVTVAGTVVACIVFNSLRREVSWPEYLIKRLQLFGEIVVNALRRGQSEKALRDSLGFEQLLAQLSGTFVVLAGDKIDDAINDALRTVGEFMAVDRVFVDQFSYDKSKFRLTHMWSAPGIPRDELASEMILSEDLPWYTNTILSGHSLVFMSPDGLPEEAANERRYIKEAGIKSSAIVPLTVDQSVIGNFGFDMIRCETDWSETSLRQLRLTSEVIANALKRKQMEHELRNAYEEIRLLKERLEAENIYLRKEIKTEQVHEGILGHSDAIKSVLSEIEQVACTDASVLISGETGVGKELIAVAIHKQSAHREKTLLKVNCAALPASLIEAELFGREKGAYTGALTRQVGRFELADGSTIFLDEISELTLDLQAKLLRVLQEGEFERLGSSKTVKVDVRVIAATNQDLDIAMRDGRFRQDLYYRLNVFPIVVPPLRDRRGDIPVLLWAFVQEFSEKMGKTIETIDDSSMEALQGYDWPGNVRELRNLTERAMIFATSPNER